MINKFKVFKSGYYSYHQTKKKSQAKKDEINFHVDEKFHEHGGIAGYRKIHAYLLKDGFDYTREQVRKSMSRAGTPTDNPYAESFMSKLKTERVKHRDYDTLCDVAEDLTLWSNNYYNQKRVNQALNYQTPFEVRNDFLRKSAA